MGDSFVSRKDRIIASAIEIISESGLSALTTKNLALKENMSEALMYKYFGGIDEVLVEVVDASTALWPPHISPWRPSGRSKRRG